MLGSLELQDVATGHMPYILGHSFSWSSILGQLDPLSSCRSVCQCQSTQHLLRAGHMYFKGGGWVFIEVVPTTQTSSRIGIRPLGVT